MTKVKLILRQNSQGIAKKGPIFSHLGGCNNAIVRVVDLGIHGFSNHDLFLYKLNI